ncbi:MAG TPA: sugar phosphate isomerase/epimerase family protein [Planctomycetota bacterium]|nr:sugar phosphate isomerase/epimerase family protein [Planctomycetota bacterium]
MSGARTSRDAAEPADTDGPRAPTRRELLAGAAAAGAWLALSGLTPAAAAAPAPARASAPTPAGAPSAAPAAAPRRGGGPPFTISLAEWSLHRALQAGVLGPGDFARVARQDFGLDAIEHVSTFLAAHVRNPPALAELRRRADDLGVASLLIMVDGEGALGDPDESARRAAVENHVKWLAAASVLGCHSIRVNAYGGGSPDEHAARAADSLHRLAVEADGHGLNVLVENHGGLSSNGAWLAGVMRRADHPRVGTLPDFGNFSASGAERYDRYQGVAEMMPFARAVSAKSYAFDGAGNETTIDYARMLRLVLAAGYHGHLGIEYEGDQLSEREGIAATLALLRRLAVQLT